MHPVPPVSHARGGEVGDGGGQGPATATWASFTALRSTGGGRGAGGGELLNYTLALQE